jgi:hypothetical protein
MLWLTFEQSGAGKGESLSVLGSCSQEGAANCCTALPVPRAHGVHRSDSDSKQLSRARETICTTQSRPVELQHAKQQTGETQNPSKNSARL